MNNTDPCNVIEFRTKDHTAPGHVANSVVIDGNVVCVAEGSVKLDFGPDERTTVTLTIIPRRVIFG